MHQHLRNDKSIIPPCSLSESGHSDLGFYTTQRDAANSKGTNPPRTVPPYHPEWVERFQLQRLVEEAPPQLNSLSIAGARTTQQLHRYGFCSPGDGQTSYGFRHAYARRLHSPLHRVTDTHGALFMGHTVAAHNKAYRQWIDGQADPLESLSLA
jgi:hypothetical protein